MAISKLSPSFILYCIYYSVTMTMGSSTDLSVPLLVVESSLTFKDTNQTRKIPWGKVLAVFYSLFLCWELTGMFLCLVRAASCFKHKVPIYKCGVNAGFPYSVEVELCCLLARYLHIIIAITVLPRIAEFPGYKAVLRQLKSLLQSWSLFFLLLATLSRDALLFVFSCDAKTPLCLPLVTSFFLLNILRAVAVCILSFTQLNSLKHKSTKTVFVFSKLTILVIFIDTLLRFMISLLAFSVDIKDGLEQQEKIRYSLDFLTVYLLLEKFGTTCFYFKIMNFFGKNCFLMISMRFRDATALISIWKICVPQRNLYLRLYDFQFCEDVQT